MDWQGTSARERYKARITHPGGAVWALRNGVTLEPKSDPGPAMLQIFARFCDFNKGRGSAGFGLASMSWDAIDAWARRRGLELIDFEIDCLFDLDPIYLRIFSEKQKKPDEGSRR